MFLCYMLYVIGICYYGWGDIHPEPGEGYPSSGLTGRRAGRRYRSPNWLSDFLSSVVDDIARKATY